MKILLADDDTGVIQALLAILKSVPGYEVRVATTGERALENAAALGGVDLLITDVVMEPMDGFTLRDEMAARYPAVRTILISGFDLGDYPEQTKNHQVLAKPIDRDTLLAAIEREFEPPPIPVPVAVPAAVARPIAVPQAKAGPARVVAQPTARPVAGPQVPRGPGPQPQPVARPVVVPGVRPVPQAPRIVAVPRGVAQPAVKPAAPVPQRKPAPAQPVARAVAIGGTPAAAAAARKETQSMPTEVESVPAPHAAQPAPIPVAAVAPAFATPEPEPQYAAGDGEFTGTPGQSLGAYQILGQLGQGRWGTVYAAVQSAINRQVGLKVLNPAEALDAGARARFIADARAKAHVQHPSILSVYEAGEASGRIFYAHEYVEGRTMEQIKESGEKLSEQTALKILRTAADGLAYFATHKIPHSPPMPGTIYLGTDGQPRLGNLATQLSDEQLSIENEIQALGRIILSVLPAIHSLTPGMQNLLKQMVQRGPQSFKSWGPLLQGIKALEPKVVPVEAAKISAQDRAVVAVVEEMRRKQKRSLYLNLGAFVSLTILVVVVCVKVLGGNERDLDEQIDIPAGEFLFGEGEPVTLPEFWIDKYEVTYGQYAKFVEFLAQHPTTEFDDPRQPRTKSQDMHKPPNWEIFYLRAKAGKPVHSVAIDLNCPVMEVDWWDAAAYAKWKGRDLPTEQEWEKAARGTKGFIYPWGDEPDPKRANSNADYHGGDTNAKGEVDGYVYWNPVDAMKGDKSPFGVMGMAGNVAEWIKDWSPAKRHPLIKGGSFMGSDLTLKHRSDLAPESISESLGFRTVSHTPPSKK